MRRRPGGPAPSVQARSLELGLGRVIELRVAGEAEGKGRPKFNTKTRRAYTPRKTTISENDIRAVWREAGEPRIEDDVAIAIAIRIVEVRPRGHYRKGGTLSAEGLRNPIPRNRKPDVDNALKIVMDALEARAYRNDVQVARALVEREWGEWPETHIRISCYGVST